MRGYFWYEFTCAQSHALFGGVLQVVVDANNNKFYMHMYLVARQPLHFR